MCARFRTPAWPVKDEAFPEHPDCRVVPPAEATAVANIEKKLTSHFNARVSLKHSPKKGKIVIEYQGNTDLQRILDRLGVSV